MGSYTTCSKNSIIFISASCRHSGFHQFQWKPKWSKSEWKFRMLCYSLEYTEVSKFVRAFCYLQNTNFVCVISFPCSIKYSERLRRISVSQFSSTPSSACRQPDYQVNFLLDFLIERTNWRKYENSETTSFASGKNIILSSSELCIVDGIRIKYQVNFKYSTS